MTQPSSESPVSDNFRSGSVTAIGIVVGFSLAFFSNWVFDDSPWTWWDVPAFLFMGVGVAYQIRALFLLLRPDSVERPRYLRTIAQFRVGLIVFASGVALDRILASVRGAFGGS
jgi:hypothetical protein